MLLPRPYPDELFSSVVARAAYYTGLSTKALLVAVFGGKTKTAIPFLMATEVCRLARLAGIEPEELILRHTVFPYSVAFMPEQERQRLLAKTLGPSSNEECIGTLSKSVSFGVRYRRVCPACIQQDLQRHGESFWRRSHMLPGVLTCAEHGVPLWETHIPLKRAAHTELLTLPNRAPAHLKNVLVDKRLEESVRRVSLSALRGQIPALQSWATTYRQAVLARGFSLTSGAAASTAFAKHFTGTFGFEYLADLGYGDTRGAQLTWPALMVRDEGPPFAATKHVLMHAYIETAETPSAGTVKAAYLRPGRAPRDLDEFDRSVSERLAVVIKSVEATGARVTVSWLLEVVGARAAYRHNSTRLPRTAALLLEFRFSEFSARQIGLRRSVRQRSPTRARRANEVKAAYEERLRQATQRLTALGPPKPE